VLQAVRLGIESFFESLFGGPKFHGTLKPWPNAQPWDEYHMHYGADIADALGIPDAGCRMRVWSLRRRRDGLFLAKISPGSETTWQEQISHQSSRNSLLRHFLPACLRCRESQVNRAMSREDPNLLPQCS
jgi:hypothetical protein